MGEFEIGGLRVDSQMVIHPGPTVGYRITDGVSTMAYIPDHEPALSTLGHPNAPEWTSGFDLAADADLLLHDAQYTADEYEGRMGWGHSRIDDAVSLAQMAHVKKLVTFHHDPSHDDAELNAMLSVARTMAGETLDVLPGREGATFEI